MTPAALPDLAAVPGILSWVEVARRQGWLDRCLPDPDRALRECWPALERDAEGVELTGDEHPAEVLTLLVHRARWRLGEGCEVDLAFGEHDDWSVEARVALTVDALNRSQFFWLSIDRAYRMEHGPSRELILDGLAWLHQEGDFIWFGEDDWGLQEYRDYIADECADAEPGWKADAEDLERQCLALELGHEAMRSIVGDPSRAARFPDAVEAGEACPWWIDWGVMLLTGVRLVRESGAIWEGHPMGLDDARPPLNLMFGMMWSEDHWEDHVCARYSELMMNECYLDCAVVVEGDLSEDDLSGRARTGQRGVELLAAAVEHYHAGFWAPASMEAP